MYEDSDIEVIGRSALKDDEEPSEHDDAIVIDSPIKLLAPVEQSTPKPTCPFDLVKSLSPDKQLQEIFVKPKIPPVTNVSSNDSMKKQSVEISTGSFYGTKKGNVKDSKKKAIAPVAPRAPERKRRASAQRALGNIRKTMEESLEFEENDDGEVVVIEKKRTRTTRAADQPKRPKRTKKPEAPPKWPELEIEAKKPTIGGKKEPRRLYPIVQHMIELDDYDKSVPNTPKPVKSAPSRHSSPELTPVSYKSTIYRDPKQQQHRFFENAMKINERARGEHFNPNASFSYLRETKSKKKAPQVVRSHADSTSPNTVSNLSHRKKLLVNFPFDFALICRRLLM